MNKYKTQIVASWMIVIQAVVIALVMFYLYTLSPSLEFVFLGLMASMSAVTPLLYISTFKMKGET
ncbi:MAG: hypothetical protein RR585_13450, partial [Coprobacillus sp.]